MIVVDGNTFTLLLLIGTWLCSVYLTLQGIRNPSYWTHNARGAAAPTDAAALGLSVVFPLAGLFYLNDKFTPEPLRVYGLWLLIVIFWGVIALVSYWIKKSHFFGAYADYKKKRKKVL